MSLKVKVEREVFAELLPHLGLYSSSSCSPLAAPAALPGEGASQGTPCPGGEVASSTAEDKPPKIQGSKDGARVEVHVLHRGAVAFSQKVTPALHCSWLAAALALHFSSL